MDLNGESSLSNSFRLTTYKETLLRLPRTYHTLSHVYAY